MSMYDICISLYYDHEIYYNPSWIRDSLFTGSAFFQSISPDLALLEGTILLFTKRITLLACHIIYGQL